MKLYKKLFIYLIFSTLFSAIACEKQAQQSQTIVAEVGDNYTINFQELRAYVFENFYNKMYTEISEAYSNALDVMVINQLKRIDFIAKGLQNDEELLNSIRRIINEELLVQYFNSQFLGKYTSDEYVRQAYENMGKEVIYKQIVLYKPENATENDILNLKKKATDIKTEIEQGRDFSEMVHQYSQHAESVKNNGIAPTLRWENRNANSLFNYIFYQQVGDILVLETSRALYIVKVTAINKLDIEPLEKIKKEIISDLQKDYMSKSLDEYDKMKEKLVDKSSFVWNQEALNKIVTWSKIPNFYRSNYKETFEQAIANGENPVILNYSGGKIDLKEYLRLVNNILIIDASADVTDNDIKKYIEEAIRTDLIVNKAKELNLDKNIFDPNTTNTVIKQKMVTLYNHVFIDSRVPEPSDADLHKFYEDQKDSLFYQLAKVNIHALIYSDKAEADEMWTQLQQGKTFKDIAKSYLVKTFIKKRNGRIETFRTDESPFLGEAAFGLKKSETDGVIEYDDPEKGKQFAIIKCTNIRPEKQLTYADVQNSIRNEYRKFMRAQIEAQVERELLDKYPTKIYKDVLKKKIAAK
ncbi:peptidyl-prolyl cis-trans isomerase [candidate division KSB1 bacterium]|nr:peptidyl-prolyl cis-trans isomerase [candidate division KSB1 bacterium]